MNKIEITVNHIQCSIFTFQPLENANRHIRKDNSSFFLFNFKNFNQNPRRPTAGGMESVNMATNKVFKILKIKTFTYFFNRSILLIYLAAFHSNCPTIGQYSEPAAGSDIFQTIEHNSLFLIRKLKL